MKEPNLLIVNRLEQGKPVYLSLSRGPAKSPDGYAGRGGRKKRMPCCNGADKAYAHYESMPTSDWSLIAR